MKRLYKVLCLDTGAEYGFVSRSAREALECMLCVLNAATKDEKAVIRATNSGATLWFEHTGKTYGVLCR